MCESVWQALYLCGRAEFAVAAIGLLAAFLTVVQIWKIPPSGPSASGFPSPSAKDASGAAPPTSESPDTSDSGPLTGAFKDNFSRTVITGLLGMTVVTFVEPLFQGDSSGGTKAIYIVVFVGSFLVLLTLSALLRGLIETIRVRTTVSRPRQPRVKLVEVFLDTFFNVIQGKNELRAKVHSDRIIELQWNLNEVVDQVRVDLGKAVRDSLVTSRKHDPLEGNEKRKQEPRPNGVRVGVTIMNDADDEVFYISSDFGSLPSSFKKQSVSWFSTYAGLPRWVVLTEDGKTEEGVVLYDNSGKTFPDLPDKLMLSKYYEERRGEYRAFVVVPYPRRSLPNRKRGCIVISFQEPDDMSRIWDLPAVTKDQPYPDNRRILLQKCKSDRVCQALRMGVNVLGQAAAAFDERVFASHISPEKRRGGSAG